NARERRTDKTEQIVRGWSDEVWWLEPRRTLGLLGVPRATHQQDRPDHQDDVNATHNPQVLVPAFLSGW
ncbi:MAG: hypothetical protein OEO17_17290, partial [Gemmatimonadota bacterium]|nr:hypothetical protein [Gemmatimonadota bacterium]